MCNVCLIHDERDRALAEIERQKDRLCARGAMADGKDFNKEWDRLEKSRADVVRRFYRDIRTG